MTLALTTVPDKDGDKLNTVPSAALDYLRLSWRVLPLHTVDEEGVCRCRLGASCERPGKHPRTPKGNHDATDAPEVIRGWFEAGDANIDVVFPENICVVDLDGTEAVRWAKAHEIEPGMTASFWSSPDHFQLLFHLQPGKKLKRSIKEIFQHEITDGPDEGVDILPGGAGYSVMPPSRHASGSRYTWVTDPEELVDMPEHLLRLILEPQGQTPAKKEPSRATRISEHPLFKGVQKGKRNYTLYRLACRCRSKDLSIPEAEVLISDLNERCQPKLDQAEVQRILISAYEKPAGPSSSVAAESSEFDPDLVPLPPTVKELLARPYPEGVPLLEGLVNERTYGLIVGPSGEGKSMVAQAIAAAIASGRGL